MSVSAQRHLAVKLIVPATGVNGKSPISNTQVSEVLLGKEICFKGQIGNAYTQRGPKVCNTY